MGGARQRGSGWLGRLAVARGWYRLGGARERGSGGCGGSRLLGSGSGAVLAARQITGETGGVVAPRPQAPGIFVVAERSTL